jgi:O-antigen ligase
MSVLPNTLKGNANGTNLPAEVGKHKSAKLRSLSPKLSTSLMMSDYWFLAGLILALFYVADPFSWKLDRIGPTKHLPLLISLCGVLLANVGSKVFQTTKPSLKRNWQILNAGLPLILLGIWIVIGGLYARKFNDIQNTFITVGLYMLFAFLAARVVMISPARVNIVRIFLLAAATLSMFMVVRMATNYDGMNVNYHELEALIVPLAVYFALRPSGLKNNDKRYSQMFLTLFFLAAGFAFRKNTGFLVLLLTLSYIWIAEWRFRFRENVAFRFWTMLWVLIVLISAVVAAGYFAQKQELLPSGNPQYRLLTYEAAWQKFVSSPIWGTGFSAQATEKFTAYKINSAQGNLSTHSDIMDLSAQGGIIALCLWLWGYLRVARISLHNALTGLRPRDDLRAAAHCLACMSLASIVVYAFNPIMLQPPKALLMWGQFGMLLGIALHLSNQRAEEARTQSAEINAINTHSPNADTSHA